MASRRNGTIYVGVTSDLQGRAYEHRTSAQPGFTSRYGCNRLVWYERHDNIVEAIARKKELKKWRRSWKLYLIEGFNTEWDDLFEICYERDNPSDAIRARSLVGEAEGNLALARHSGAAQRNPESRAPIVKV